VYFRQHDVLENGTIGQQVERLKDESNTAAAQSGPLILAQLRRLDTVKNVLPAGWAVQATEDIQQRGFPRAGRTGYRQPFAAPQHEVDIDQCVDRWIGPELLAHFTQIEDMVGIGSSRFDRHRRPYVLHGLHLTEAGGAAGSAVLWPTTTNWPGASRPAGVFSST